MDEHINVACIMELYEKEISKNVRNKRRIYNFERHKMRNINTIIRLLNDENYRIRKYNIFMIKEPKPRVIMSLDMIDKIINHFITRYALIPKLEKYLDMRNVATRKNMGTDYGLRLIKKFIEKNKKYDTFYILKIDISKYFYNIDHEILKKMLIKDLTDREYNLMCNIIDSSDMPYINERINSIKPSEDIPIYKYGKGLPIGNMTSQFLSIFYLNGLDHYIVHDLHLKYYVRYMDDFIIMHYDKEYLKKCMKLIIDKLDKDYKLKVNRKKTNVTNIKEGFVFLGYRFRVINKKTVTVVRQETYRKVKKKVREVNYLYDNGYVSLEHYFSCISNYLNTFKYGSVKKIRRYIMRSM